MKHVLDTISLKNLSKLKLVLLILFSSLVLFQFIIGLRSFEDYLIVFIFVLFLNDLFFKMTHPQQLQQREEHLNRFKMSAVFLGLFVSSLLIEAFSLSNDFRITAYKLGFVLWAQIFLLDSFLHYKKTQSKQWLLFANTAVLLIIFGAFAN